MFCSKCGKQLIENAAFCSGCGCRIEIPQGAAIQQPLPVYSPAPSGEETVLVMKMTRKMSFSSAVVCHVVFKRNWFILAHVTPNLQRIENARLQEMMKAQNLGVMKRSAATMRFWGDFHKRYYTMPTDAILAEEPTNQAINYGMITLFDFANGYTISDDDSCYDHDGHLHLTLLSGETIKFTHQGRHDKNTYALFTGLFGPRLKYKK